MANWKKARWYMPAAGGVSITAFYEFKEETRHDPITRQTTRYRSSTPVMKSIRPSQSGELHEASGVMLKADEFMIQDIPHNTEDGVAMAGKISPLKAMLKSGRVMLDDYAYECAILETEMKDLYNEVKIEDEMVAIDMTPAGSTPDRERIKKETMKKLQEANKVVSKEKQAALDELMTIQAIKINKASVVEGLYEKGYENLEEVKGSSVEILMTVKGIGKKVAEGILDELNVETEETEED